VLTPVPAAASADMLAVPPAGAMSESSIRCRFKLTPHALKVSVAGRIAAEVFKFELRFKLRGGR
jgi:hypothetical protein